MKDDINLNEIEAAEVQDRDNLAVVAVVSKLEPIEGKDFVELVHLKDVGYTFVCEKIHAVDDYVVYIKYDTIVPDNELFAFMAQTKFRVKAKAFTHKDEDGNVVGKTYSQGIVLPYKTVRDYLNSCCPDGIRYVENPWEEGQDITSELGVIKYIPKESGSGSSLGQMLKKGDFPTHLLSKTDEDNLASRTKALEELDGKAIYITLKSEGSSCTAYLDPESLELNVCTRNNNLKEVEGSKFWQAVNKYNLKETLLKYPNIAIQGELVGQGVQRNHHTIEGVDLHVFNMVDMLDNRRRLSYFEMLGLVEDLELTMVKVVWDIPDFVYTEDSFDMFQEFADKQVYDNGTPAEGIVIRPCIPFVSQKLRTLWSGKVINRDYKL